MEKWHKGVNYIIYKYAYLQYAIGHKLKKKKIFNISSDIMEGKSLVLLLKWWK
jgi:hypothetical protein